MNQNPNRVLVIEDDSLFFEAVKMALKSLPIEIFWAKNSPEALKLLKEKSPFAVAIVDQNLPNIKGDELALVIKKQYPDQQIVFATGDLSKETLTLLLQSGLGVGFIPKGQSCEALLDPILKAISTFEREIKVLGFEPLDPLEAERKLLAHGIVGRSEALQKILERKEAYRRLPASTIIFGESGTGKEVIAYALAEGINEILPVNCSTFIGREHMMEAELFGVVKGAFTGADKDRAGLFEIAKGRIIFLDEIHHLSLSAQAKLLRVLQEKKVVRVGDNADNAKTCEFQIISAAKPELWDQLQSGSFLKDLFFRISTYQVVIPSLVDRKEDIEPLVEHFAKEIRHKSKLDKRFRSSTIRLMESYSWPGEVRELRNMVEHLFGETKGDIIEPQDFTEALKRKLQVTPSEAIEAVGYETYMRMIEVAYIKKVLNQSSTQKEAAAKMSISKSTLNNRLKILGIDADEYLGSKPVRKPLDLRFIQKGLMRWL